MRFWSKPIKFSMRSPLRCHSWLLVLGGDFESPGHNEDGRRPKGNGDTREHHGWWKSGVAALESSNAWSTSRRSARVGRSRGRQALKSWLGSVLDWCRNCCIGVHGRAHSASSCREGWGRRQERPCSAGSYSSCVGESWRMACKNDTVSDAHPKEAVLNEGRREGVKRNRNLIVKVTGLEWV